MSILFRIPTTVQFDQVTPPPPGAVFRLGTDGVYELVNADGSAITTAIGQIPFQLFTNVGASPSRTALLTAISHNGGAGVTLFEATVAAPDGTGAVALYPTRSTNPQDDQRAGTSAMFNPSVVLALASNAAGAQSVTLELIFGVPEIDLDAVAAATATPSSSSSQQSSVRLDSLIGAGAYTTFLAWTLPQAQIETLTLTNNALTDASAATVTATIVGQATMGDITLPAASAAGSTASLNPGANNVINTGDVLQLVVGGAQANPGDATVAIRTTPV